MLILAIDTAAAACAACLWRDGVVLAEKHEIMSRGQDARLLPLILELLQTTATDFAALDRIAVTRGPGSFTGIRIGLAAARGIGLAAGKPVLGLDRFNLYRQTLQPNNPLLLIIDSKRDELFYSFAGAAPLMATSDQIIEKFAGQNIALASDQPAIIQALVSRLPQAEMLTLPQHEVIVAAQWAASIRPENFPDHPARPLYIRPPDVSFGPTPVADTPTEHCA